MKRNIIYNAHIYAVIKMQIINFWVFHPEYTHGLDLSAEVSFRSFIMWAVKPGPAMFGKVFG